MSTSVQEVLLSREQFEAAHDGTVRQEIERFREKANSVLAGEITDDEFRSFRLRFGIYGQRQPGVQMVRTKIPGGLLTARQMEQLAAIADEFEHIRDFFILHYRLTRRDDTPFWRERAALGLPESLAQRIAHYQATGRVVLRQPELFNDLDWFWIFEGMGVVPRDYDPLVDTVDYEQVKRVVPLEAVLARLKRP